MPDQQLIGYDENGKPIYGPPTGGGRASGPPQQAGGGGRGAGGAGPAPAAPSQGGRASGPSKLTPVVSAADRDRPIEGWDRNGKPIYGAKKPEAPETPQTRSAWGEFAPSIDPVGIVKGLFQLGNDVRLASQGRAMETEEAKRIMNVWNAETGNRDAWDNTLRTVESIPILGPHLVRQGENAQVGNWGAFAGGVGGLTFDLASGELMGKGLPVKKGGPVIGGAARVIAPKLEKIANAGSTRRIVDVIAPKTGQNKTRFGNMAKDVAPGLAREPGLGAWTPEGFHGKAQGAFEDAAAHLEDVADARNAGNAYPSKPVVDALKEERQKLVMEAVEGSRLTPKYEVGPGGTAGRPITASQEASIAPVLDAFTKADDDIAHVFRAPNDPMPTNINRVGRPIGEDVIPKHNHAQISELDSAIEELKRLGPVARYEAIRRQRASYDPVARVKYAPAVTADFLAKSGQATGAATVTGVLRRALAHMDPATAAANKPYSFWKKANDVMDATAETERVRPNRAGPILRRTVGTGVGAATGGWLGALKGAAAAEAAGRIAGSGFTPKIKTARLLANIADASGRTTGATATNATRAAILSALLADQRKPQTEEQRKRYEQYKKEHPE